MTRPLSWSAMWSHVDAGDLGAAECGDEPDEDHRAVAGAGQVGFGWAAGGLPGALGGEGGQDVPQLGWHQRAGLVGVGGVLSADALPDADDEGVGGGVGVVLQFVDELDRRQSAAHGADLRAVPGEQGEVAGDGAGGGG